MNLKTALSQFCNENNLNDLQCIIHIALLNYVSNLSKNSTSGINISPKIFDSFTGIGEEKANQLFKFLSKETNYMDIYYEFDCPEKNIYSFSILEKDITDPENIEMNDGCSACDEYHTFSISDSSYKISYLGHREEIIKELSLSGESIRNFIVLNTNEDNFEKLAKILVSNIKIEAEKKEEVEKGLFKYMQTIKKFTGLVADITEDGSKITGNVKNIFEDVSGLSTLISLFKS